MTKTLTPLALAILLATAACNKDDEAVITETGGPYTNLGTVMGSLTAPAQTFTIDGTRKTQFRGAQGTRFVFPANGFSTTGGQAVTGSVQVVVREYLTRGDIIFSGAEGVSTSSIQISLVSGGQLFVYPTQGGKALLMKPDSLYQAHIPQFAYAVPGYMPLYGMPLADNYNTGIIWAPSPTTGVVSNGLDTVSIATDSVGYIAPGQLIPLANTKEIRIQLTGPSGLTQYNTRIYALPKNLKSVIPLPAFGINENKKNLPAIEMNFVAISVVNGFFYGGITAGTPDDNRSFSINLQQKDPATFKADVSALD